MAAILKVIVVDSDAASRGALRRMLVPAQAVVVVEYETIGEAFLAAPAYRADVIIVEVTDDHGAKGTASITSIERLTRALPETSIVVTGPVRSADFVVQVIRAGALEYLQRPIDRDELIAALRKLQRGRRAAVPDARPSCVTSVFSAKGGTGATTLAINLAVALAEGTSSGTLLVELDTRASDVATFLDVHPTYSVIDALESLDRMDEPFLRGLVARFGKELSVLVAPRRVEPVVLERDRVHAMVEILRAHFGSIVIDLRHDFDAGTMAALEASDTILVLTAPNVAAVRATAAALGAFRHGGIDLARVKPVVMREGTGHDVTLGHVKEALEIPLFWSTPDDYAAALSAINHGRPLVSSAPRSKLGANIRELARVLSSGPSTTAPAPKRAASRWRLAWNLRGVPAAD
jgi:pilus assembly protein CpaE